MALLRDQLVEVAALRGLVFDYGVDRIKGLLLKAGVRISPIVTAVKKKPHGDPVLDEDGDPKLRICVHCSAGSNAPNNTMHSAEHTRQKTTSQSCWFKNSYKRKKYFPTMRSDL